MPGVYYIILVMEKKILILLMACDKDIYKQEEQACRDTFLKDADKAGVPYFFYRGISEEGQTSGIDASNHDMRLLVPDDLKNTARKTVEAFRLALEMDNWDYVVKTNVSTWLDVNKILESVKLWEGKEDRNIYGARYLVNEHSKNVPFPRGHFVILSREIVSGIVKWAPKLLLSNSFPKTDDTLLCMAMLYHIQKILGDNYQQRLMEVPSVISWSEDIENSNGWTDAFSIRCKDEEKMGNTPMNMRKVHELKHKNTIDRKLFKPIELMETKFGLITYGTYVFMNELFKKVKEEPTAEEKPVEKEEEAPGKIDDIKNRLKGLF